VCWRNWNFFLLGLFPTKEKLYSGNKLAIYMFPQSKILPVERMLQQLRTPRPQQFVTACNILQEDIGQSNSWVWIDTSAQYRMHRVRRNPNIRHEEGVKQIYKKLLPHPLSLPLQWTFPSFDFSFGASSPSCVSFVACRWRNNSVIDVFSFFKEWIYEYYPTIWYVYTYC